MIVEGMYPGTRTIGRAIDKNLLLYVLRIRKAVLYIKKTITTVNLGILKSWWWITVWCMVLSCTGLGFNGYLAVNSSTVMTQAMERDMISKAIQCWSIPRMLATQSEMTTGL